MKNNKRGRPELYLQCGNELRRLIQEHYRVGDFLEGETGLAVRLGVSRNTLRKALQMLDAEGLVESLPGKGTKICSQTVSVSVVEWGIKPEMARIRKALESADIPIRLDSQFTLPNYYNKLRKTLQEGTAPDVFFMYSPHFAELLPYAMNLSPLLEKETELTEHCHPGILDRLKVGRGFQGLPLWFSPLMFVANNKALKGMSRNRLEQSRVADFPGICRDLTRFDGNIYQQYGYMHNPILARVLPLLMTGGWSLGNDLIECSPFLTKENETILSLLAEAIAGLSLFLPYGTDGSERQDQYKQMLGHLAAGHAAFLVDRISFEMEKIKAVGTDLRYFPLFFDKTACAPLMGLYAFVNKTCRHPEKAWQVIRTLMTKECQQQFVKAGLGLSVRMDCEPETRPEKQALDYGRNGTVFVFPESLQNKEAELADCLYRAVLRLSLPEDALKACDQIVAENMKTIQKNQKLTSAERSVTVGIVQFDAVPEKPEHNLKQMERLTVEAVKKGARWVLFHEGTLTDYTPDLTDFAEKVPEGPATTRIIALAKKYNCFISFGLSEKENGRFFLTQVFVGPEGYIYHYRKTWLHHKTGDNSDHRDEWAVYDPGTGPELFEIDGVNVSCFICADGGSKRCTSRVRDLRPEVVFYPNNRSKIISEEELGGHAEAIRAPVLLANRVGVSWGHQCMGGCAVADSKGRILTRANCNGKEDILIYELKIPKR